MELEWSKAESEKLARHYQSFVSGLESDSLKALTLRGLEQFVAFPDVCREAMEVTQDVSNELMKKFQDPHLTKTLASLSCGELSDSPTDMIQTFEKSNELSKRLGEMSARKEDFFKQYSTLFQGALYEVTRAANALKVGVNGEGVLPGLTETALLDAGGVLIPGLGTVQFLKRRVLYRAKHLHEQLQKSAGVADSFILFSEFMEQVTEQMNFATVAVVEDAETLGSFVEFELPARIAEINALKKK